MGCPSLIHIENQSALRVAYRKNHVFSKSSTGDHRYGFSGQESDGEVHGGGNTISWSNRMYDSRLGRWMSVDGKTNLYRSLSPYTFVGNSPLIGREVDGDFFNFALAAGGALIGGVIGGAIEYGSQVASNLNEGKSWGAALTSVDGRKILASTAEGAIVGTLAGLTGGSSLLFAGAGAGLGVIGGGVKRAINGEEVFDAKEMLIDGLSGIAGGLAQKYIGSLVKKIDPGVVSNLITKRVLTTVIKKAPNWGRGVAKSIGKAVGGLFNKDKEEEAKPVGDGTIYINLEPISIKVNKETGNVTDKELKKTGKQLKNRIEEAGDKE
jgi:RHS repeat-associated protein